MAFAHKKDYSVDDYKAKYQDITALYDYADNLIVTVEDSSAKNPEQQLSLVESLVNEVADATDILAEEFILVAESNKPNISSKFNKKRIENALRKVFVAINNYHENAKQLAIETSGKVVNISNAIVEKIQQQLDKVIAIFLEFANISLQSIMGRAEMDALRIRDARIALMMHQLSLSQHGG